MITDEMINRINELAKKSKVSQLTQEEKEEQKLLREQYLNAIRSNFETTLQNIKFKDN